MRSRTPSARRRVPRTPRALGRALACAAACALAAGPALAGDPAPTFQTGSTGNGQPFSNYQPSLGLNYFMPLTGVFPSRARNAGGYLGQIRIFAGNYNPGTSLDPEGQLLQVNDNDALFSILGTTYGGDGRTTFALPDLAGAASVHHGQGPGLSNWNLGQHRGNASTTLGVNHLPSHNHAFAHPDSPTGNTGGGESFSNFQPTVATTFMIATQGIFPSRTRGSGGGEPLLGQVAQFAGNFAPQGWAEANGQLLDIASNQALFSILGTTYGGDGRTTFALPDLRGRVAVHPGQANNQGNTWTLGETAGVESHTLGVNHLPEHTHTLPDLFDGTTSTDPAGSGDPFSNTQPGLGLNFIIATEGVFPSNGGTLPDFEPLLGEIYMFAGNFAPRGFALLDGQLLDIASNQALFSILGTTYGGDGRTTFALPDLRGRTPVHADGSLVQLGELLGSEFTTLGVNNLPPHTHDYVPEPTSAALLLAGAGLLRRRRR